MTPASSGASPETLGEGPILEGLVEALAAVGAAGDVEAASEAALRGALALIDGFRAVIRVCDPEAPEPPWAAGTLLSLIMERRAGGDAEVVLRDRRAGPPRPRSGAARLLAGEPGLLIHDAQALDPATYSRTQEARAYGRRALVGAPLRVGGRTIGVLSVDHREPGAYTERDLLVLRALADRAAGAIERAGLEDAARRHARERALAAERERVAAERERIEADLHDGTMQQLYGAVLALTTAGRMLAGTPDGAAASEADVDGARDLLRAAAKQLLEAIAETRRLVRGLPPRGAERGLGEGLAALAEEVRRATGTTPLVEVAPAVDDCLQFGATGELLLLAREALSNAACHAGASAIGVRVVVDDGHLELTISDDGRGFDHAASTPGWGLRTMTERARRLGGECTITSAPGQGTRVRVVVPVTRET